MTAERAAKLEALGFGWELSAAALSKQHRNIDNSAWEVQLAKLKDYKREHGDCNVPRGWAEDPQLATWVANQRHSKKKLDRGESSNRMTVERVTKLEALRFAWQIFARSPRPEGKPAKKKETKTLQPETFSVERITKERVGKGGTAEVLVRWADYGPSDDSWEPKRNINADCPQVVRAWQLQKAGRKEEAEVALRENGESVDEAGYDNEHRNNAAASRLEVKRREETTVCGDAGCSDGPTGLETLRYLIQQFPCPISVVY
jgi:hypothetical protein